MMAPRKRKRSGMTDLMLVPVDARQRRRVRVYLALALVFAPIFGFVAGDFYARESRLSEQRQTFRLQARVAELDQLLRQAREDLALHRTGNEVSLQAQEQVRGELKELRDQLAELEEAVAFYKSVMAPGSGEAGLRVEKLDVAATTTPGVYGFRLVLTQVGDNRSYMSGNITLTLSGRRDQQQVRLNGSEVLADGAETRFRFRYFQELTGRLTVPDDVEPDQIIIEAMTTGRRAEKIEKNFIWQVQERNSAWAG